MKLDLSETITMSILLVIILLAASAGSKVLTTTAQGLLERALQVSEPRK